MTPFVPRLATAFGFPFRSDSGAAIVATALFSALVSYVPLVSIAGFAARAGLGIFVLRATARGEDRLPMDGSAMDSTDPMDWLRPVLVYLAVLVACVGPALAVYVARPDDTAIVVGVAGLGLVYFPAAVTGAALSDPPSALAAFDVVRAATVMTRVPGPYLLTVLATAFVVALAYGANLATSTFAAGSHIPVLPTLVVHLASAASFAMMGRVLGLFVDHHREDIGDR